MCIRFVFIEFAFIHGAWFPRDRYSVELPARIASLAAFGRSCLFRALKVVFPRLAVPGVAGEVRFARLLDELVEGQGAETRSHQREQGCLEPYFRNAQQRFLQRHHPWQQHLGCTQKVLNHSRPPRWSEYQAQGGVVAFTITQHAGWVRRDHVRSRAIDLLKPELGTTAGDGNAFGSLSPCTLSAAARQKADECEGARCTHPHECQHLRKIVGDTVPHDNSATVVEISSLNARSKGYLAPRFLLTLLMLFSSSSPCT